MQDGTLPCFDRAVCGRLRGGTTKSMGTLPIAMMSGSAGFHTDQASRNLAKEVDDLFPPQLTGNNDLAHTIHAVHLEYVLGEINADGANLHMDDPLR